MELAFAAMTGVNQTRRWHHVVLTLKWSDLGLSVDITASKGGTHVY